ncbi:MAG TPA: N-formylglutamate amidohydrolase, partial [Pseudoxanthomonas sp.]|nr:N-formylglutamate amidohydrolase [Pseudoxanthomonas sp.]
LNLGTAGGASCSPALRQRLADVLAAQHDHGFVIDGRFKGGYITRHYGNPAAGVDAVQLELAQSTYMDERTFEYLPERAARLQVLLGRLLQAAVA